MPKRPPAAQPDLRLVQSEAEIYDLIEALAGEGKGIVFISSEFSEMLAVCDRIVVLREGRFAGELEGEEVNERAIVELCYAHEPAAGRAAPAG